MWLVRVRVRKTRKLCKHWMVTNQDWLREVHCWKAQLFVKQVIIKGYQRLLGILALVWFIWNWGLIKGQSISHSCHFKKLWLSYWTLFKYHKPLQLQCPDPWYVNGHESSSLLANKVNLFIFQNSWVIHSFNKYNILCNYSILNLGILLGRLMSVSSKKNHNLVISSL